MNNNQTSNPPHHCMVVHAYYPLGETRVEREAQALLAHGYEVDVLCLRGAGESKVSVEDGVQVYRLPVKRHKQGGLLVQLLEYLAFFALVFFKLIGLQRRQHYRVVQIHNLPDFLVFAALIPKLSGARLILDLHDLMPEFFAARSNRDITHWMVRLIQWQEKVSCDFADHVITVTSLWRDTLIERGIPAGKCSVVMNVADDRLFNRAVVAQVRPEETERFRLIYHGNLTHRYGLDLLVQAVAQVRPRIPQIHLTIHGQGDYWEPLQQLVETLEVQDHVTLSNQFMPTADLPAFIKKAHLGVIPYRDDVFTDGILPTKLMEYTALGIPAIAARTSAIAAYFDDTMVQFFTPGDAADLARCIQELYDDRERLERLAREAEKFSQRYNWMALRADYVATVKRLGAR